MANYNWMEKLDPKIKDVSICFLAIPGTHDSLSYSVTPQSKVSPDAPNIAKVFNKLCGPIMRRITYNWCVTQKLGIIQQFLSGIRYFDIRVAVKGSKFFSCHGLYGMNVIEALHQLNILLDMYSKEVVVLDFQHLYAFQTCHHVQLINSIQYIFGEKLCPTPIDIKEVTLNWLQKNCYQVILIYRDNRAKNVPFLWDSSKWITLWPDTTDIKTLYTYLIQTLAKRPDNAGFVSQCLFTPNTSFVTWHLLSTLKEQCCVICDRTIRSMWIVQQRSLSPKGVNVIIADFVDLPEFDFCNTVINLNKESLPKQNS